MAFIKHSFMGVSPCQISIGKVFHSLGPFIGRKIVFHSQAGISEPPAGQHPPPLKNVPPPESFTISRANAGDGRRKFQM